MPDIEEFVCLNGDDGTHLWVFHHIPKTAGTSFVNEVMSHVQPNYNIHIPNDSLARIASDADTERERALAFERFWELAASSPFVS